MPRVGKNKEYQAILRGIRYILVDFFASGLSNTNDVELIRKTNMLNAIGVVAILALVPLGIDAIRLGNTVIGWFDILVAILLFSEIIYLRVGTNYKLVINVGIWAAGTLFFYLMVSQWMGGAAYLWYFTFPLLTSFLLGSKKGLWGAITLIFATILLFVFGERFGFKSSQTAAFELRFVMAYGVVAVFAYAFEKTRENTQLRVIRQNTELNDRLSELELLKNELEKTNSVLDERVKVRTAELQQANATLDAELREKDILLKEIHHRVKNNLQIISSLLYLQSQSLKDENSKALFEDSRNRILSMAMVHENLYQSKDIANVNMKDYIKTLTSALMHSYSNPNIYVELELIVDHLPVTIDKAIPLGLIVNELVSNALKYAFTDFHKKADSNLSAAHVPMITVALKQETYPGVILVVADNGRGIPDEINFRESPSLGLQLVNSLVNQIDGSVELCKDNGTEYKISFNIG